MSTNRKDSFGLVDISFSLTGSGCGTFLVRRVNCAIVRPASMR